MLVSSTPITSSPWIEDFPILDLKKSTTLLNGLSLFLIGDFGSLIPFNDGFFIFKFLNFPNIFEILLFGAASTLSSVFSTSLLFNNVSSTFVIVWGLIFSVFSCGFCSVETVWFIFSSALIVVAGCSWVVARFFCASSVSFFSFSLSACTSSNHFSKIGIASSKFCVPDDEIFCFPSI